MVGSEGDAKWCSEDQWSVVKFFNDSMRPGKQFLVIHDQLVWSGEGFVDSILSTAPIPAWCLGRVNLNSIEVNIKLRLKMTFISVLTRSLPALTMFSPASIQMI